MGKYLNLKERSLKYINEAKTPLFHQNIDCTTCIRFPLDTKYKICFVEEECKKNEMKYWRRYVEE
jgi:hypothetical protein